MVGTAIAIAMAASAAASAYSAHKQGQLAEGQLAQQQGVLDQQTALSKRLGGYAADSYEMSKPALQQAMNYYRTVANGSRSAINETNAPQIAQVQDIYKGAAGNIPYQMRGPQKDMALADLNRQKAGQLSMMPIQAKQNGVTNLANLGVQGMGLAGNFSGAQTGALSGQSGSLNTMFGIQNDAMKAQNAAYSKIGENMGNMLLPYLMGQKAAKAKPAGFTPEMAWGSY